MHLIYLTNARLPTEKAHGLAAVKLSEAFAKEGVSVLMVAPRRVNRLKADVFEYYRAERIFRILKLPCIDFLWLRVGERFLFSLQLFSFSLAAFFWLAWQRTLGRLDNAVVFSHDHVPLLFASFIVPHIAYDIHDYPGKSYFFRRVLSRAGVLAVQTKWKIEALSKDFDMLHEKIVYWPNGVDAERFGRASKEEARRKLGLPADKILILYSGSLQKWKGVETLVRSSEFMPSDAVIYIVGGTKKEIARAQCLMPDASNIVFVGQKPWDEIPLWLAAADVLALPNTGREEISARWTSPMKLFEYMAAGRPIVASDIPSIREVLGFETGFFAKPDDPRSFGEAIARALGNPQDASLRAGRAQEAVRQYTWNARAEKILRAPGLRAFLK